MAAADDVHADWIVCLGSERSIRSGTVSCPRQHGRRVAIGACHDCRLLEYVRDERDRPDPCSTDPSDPRHNKVRTHT
jgi:hypothetical protein